MNELLSDLASHVTTLRTGNMFRGLPNDLEPPAPSTDKFLIDTQEMLDHIRLQQSMQNATQRNRRNKGPNPNVSVTIMVKPMLFLLNLLWALVLPLLTNQITLGNPLPF